jgi:hypothetical protein
LVFFIDGFAICKAGRSEGVIFIDMGNYFSKTEGFRFSFNFFGKIHEGMWVIDFLELVKEVKSQKISYFRWSERNLRRIMVFSIPKTILCMSESCH